MTTTAMQQIELTTAEEMTTSPALKATEDFINSRALEILCEWVNDPALVEIVEEAERVRAAEAARKDAA